MPEKEVPRVKGLVERDSGNPRWMQALTVVAIAIDMRASIAIPPSPWTRSGMPTGVAIAATI